MNPNVEKFEKKVKHFIATANVKGSKIAANLLPECAESEVRRLEANYGIKFTDEVLGYAKILGRGIRNTASATSDLSALEFMPGYDIISLDMGLEYLNHYKHRSVFLTRKFKTLFEESYLIPFLSNVVDFVSFCKNKQGGTGVLVKRNSHDVRSELWLSACSFFDFQTECWELGGYKLDSSTDIFLWDTKVVEELMRKYSAEFVQD